MFSRLLSTASRSKKKLADAERELITSGLLPSLLEGCEERDRTVVLDAGSGAQCTVEYFSKYNGRIHFVDLYSCELLANVRKENDPKETVPEEKVLEEIDADSACEIFLDFLTLPQDVTFDICLLWDVLLYVDLPVLEGLSRALSPHIDRQTLGYAFGSHHATTLDNSRYGISDESHLEVRSQGADSIGQYYPHSQQQLAEHFNCLAIQRATLLKGGRLELLFSND